MTKILPEELNLKTNPLLDDATTITPAVTNMLQKNSLSICATRFNPSGSTHQSKPKFSRPKASKPVSFKTRLGRAVHKLHNLENSNELDKQLNIDLCKNLYQMEDY